MTAIAYVDGPRLRRALLAACAHARRHKADLNRINVFPVPDGDTGTNLVLTLDAVARTLGGLRDRRVDRVAAGAARAALLGARGNCGMMLSQFLLGFASALEGRRRVAARGLGRALVRGSESLDKAVTEPVEGTILTVVRDSAAAAAAADGAAGAGGANPAGPPADGASSAGPPSNGPATATADSHHPPAGADVAHTVTVMLAAAQRSLERTPELLPVLAEAGVVDAGAKGFVQMVAGVSALIEHGEGAAELAAGAAAATARTSAAGDDPDEARPADGLAHPEDGASAAAANGAPGHEPPAWSPIGEMEHPLGRGTRRYCTEILVEGPDLPPERVVRDALAEGSEELIVIRASDVIKIHLHTDHPQQAVDYCATIGTVAAHKAEDMFAQFEAARAATGAVRRPVGVVVDSGCDLPDAVLQAHGIHMIPLLIIDGERTLRDRIDVQHAEYLARLEAKGPLPTTSLPSPGQFMQAFEEASADSEALVAVTIAASLSGIFRSAQHGAELAHEVDVHVVDSRGASVLTGMLALKAAELAETGRTVAEIVAELDRIRSQSGIAFTVRTLDRLVASGRISHFAGWMAGMLDLKPVLGLNADGTVAALGKARGARRVRRLLLDKVFDAIPADAKKVRFGIIHAGAPGVVEKVRAEIEERHPGAPIMVTPITPVILTHLGAGSWGVGYLLED